MQKTHVRTMKKNMLSVCKHNSIMILTRLARLNLRV